MDSQEEGYNVNLVNGLPPRLQCPLCQKLMRKPIQTPRGENACSSCYEKNKGDSNICPIDHEVIELDGTYSDKCKEREIFKLACFCPNAKFGCGWQGSLRFLEDHKAVCQSGPIRCISCTEEISPSEMEQHHKQCLKMGNLYLCPYSSAGCEFKVFKGEALDEHMNKSHLLHAHLQNKTISKLSSRVKRLESTNVSNKETQMDHVEEARRIKNVVNDVSQNLSSKIDEFQKFLQFKLSEMEAIIKARDVDDVVENVNVNLHHQISSSRFDGNLIWKIDNFETRYHQAVIGETTPLHSAPLFTSRYGYKFCARLYLNGDGMGKGTHMSLFFVLMKSEFDNLLEWPFNKKVTFTLINQENRAKNVVETFKANPNSSSFKRPTKHMNIASGCPCFVSQESLNAPQSGFIKNDSLFLIIKVSACIDNSKENEE